MAKLQKSNFKSTNKINRCYFQFVIIILPFMFNRNYFFVFYNFFPDFLMLCNSRHVFQLNHKNLDIRINFLLFEIFWQSSDYYNIFLQSGWLLCHRWAVSFFVDHFLQHVMPVTFFNIILKTLIFDTVWYCLTQFW